MSTSALAQVLALAEPQHGLFASSQAASIGLSSDQAKRLVRGGVLERYDYGVFRIKGVPGSWEQGLTGALLRSGPEAAASHRAAARLWGLEGCERAPVELTVRRGNRRRPRGAVVYQSVDLQDRDVTTRLGLAVTKPARTLVDLGAVVSPHVFEVAFDDAIRRGLTTMGRVRAEALRLGKSGRRGPAMVRELIEDRNEVDQMTDSGFETLLLRVLREAGLPAPITQHLLCAEDGRPIIRFDAAYVHVKVGIEADSERWHMSRQRFIADRSKRNTAESLGWRVLAFTYHHVTRQPEYVATTVERTLDQASR